MFQFIVFRKLLDLNSEGSYSEVKMYSWLSVMPTEVSKCSHTVFEISVVSGVLCFYDLSLLFQSG